MAAAATYSQEELNSVKFAIITAIDNVNVSFFETIPEEEKPLYTAAMQNQKSGSFNSHLERALHWCFSKDKGDEYKRNAAKIVTILVRDFKAPVSESVKPLYEKAAKYLRTTSRPAVETTEVSGRRSMDSISSDYARGATPSDIKGRTGSLPSFSGWSFTRTASADDTLSGLPPLSARHTPAAAAAAGGAGGRRADSPDPRARGDSAARAFTPSNLGSLHLGSGSDSDDATAAPAPAAPASGGASGSALTVEATLRRLSGVGGSFRAAPPAAANEGGLELPSMENDS